jgi:hypothetical protein
MPRLPAVVPLALARLFLIAHAALPVACSRRASSARNTRRTSELSGRFSSIAKSQKLLTQLGLKPNVQACVGFMFHGAHIATPPQHAATHSTNSMACMEQTCAASAAAGPQIRGLAVRLP